MAKQGRVAAGRHKAGRIGKPAGPLPANRLRKPGACAHCERSLYDHAPDGASLREGGFSQERINAMTPSEAWEILQAEAGRIATELSKLDRDGAIKSEQDASFYANLIRIFDATYTGPVGSTSPDHAILTDEQLVPPPPEGLSTEERAAYYQADLEDAIGEEYIDRDYQPQVFQSRRSSAQKKKRSPRKLQK